MNVFFGDDGVHLGKGRNQPWGTSNHDTPGQYYDFKKDPHLIRTSLEELKHWENYSATETFYELIEWINGVDSQLETSDCMFRGVQQNSSDRAQFPYELQALGRVMFFCRKLEVNTNDNYIQRIMLRTQQCIEMVDTSFTAGCVEITKFPTSFTELDINSHKQEGHQLSLKFWAWGNSESEAMNNLDRLFKNIRAALENLSDQIAQANQKTTQANSI